MHDVTAKTEHKHLPSGIGPNFERLYKLYPTSAYLRRKAPRNVPFFSFEYGDTGAGADVGIAHNWAALDAIKIVPRYGGITSVPPVDVELFGTRYAAPIGIAPMGGPSLVWPGADLLLAKAAQRARVPYTLGVAGGATIEEVGKVAPDVFWLQLYRFYQNEHAIGFDLIRRATDAGVKVMALTLDVPVRTTRSREAYAGLGREFHPNLRMIYEMVTRPKWLLALLRHGYPRFATIRQYVVSGRAPMTSSASRARTWAACFPGRRSRGIAIAGKARCWSRAFCTRPTRKKQFRSASRAFGYQTTADGKSRRWRRRSIACLRLSRRLAKRPPSYSTAVSAADRT